VSPAGIIPEPTTRTIGRAFAMAMPYVSFEAQILSFLGFEVRIGYVLPVFGIGFEEGVGIPAPSLELRGPFVGVSIVFGGISHVGGATETEARARESGTLALPGRARLLVENSIGDIAASGYADGATQSASVRTVEWTATYEQDAAGSRVEWQEGPDGASLRTKGSDRVDYALRIPSGTDLEVDDGAGSIHINGHSASLVRISLGAGELWLAGVEAGEVSLSVGAGEIVVSGGFVGSLSAHAGVGRIVLDLPADVSATISASVGLGTTSIEGFTGMVLHERGLLWTKSTDAILGSGGGDYSLSVGIGRIETHPVAPPSP
jgi:hypothetical protein